jgi:hypothetical protein
MHNPTTLLSTSFNFFAMDHYLEYTYPIVQKGKKMTEKLYRKRCKYFALVVRVVLFSFVILQMMAGTRIITTSSHHHYDPHDQSSYHPHTSTNAIRNKEFQFQYQHAVSNFSLPVLAEWMEEFLKHQPIMSHDATLSDPDQKFIVMTCHKVRMRPPSLIINCCTFFEVTF